MREVKYAALEDVIVIRLTTKAVLTSIDGREVWIPQSLIFEEDLAEMSEEVIMEVNVQEWFCKKEGLI